MTKATWHGTALAEAFETLCQYCICPHAPGPLPQLPLTLLHDHEAVERWVHAAAAVRGIEAEHVESTLADLDNLLLGSFPCLLSIPGLALEDQVIRRDPDDGFLVIIGASRRRVRVVTPQRRVECVPRSEVSRALSAGVVDEQSARIAGVLDALNVSTSRQARVAKLLLREAFGKYRIGGCFMLRPVFAQSFLLSMTRGLWRQAAALLCCHLVEYGLLIGAFGLLGRATVTGHWDNGIGWAWLLLLSAIAPFRALAARAQAMLTVAFGIQLKQRLLVGAFRLPPDALKAEGTGLSLGRVIEAEAIELLGLGGGLLGLISVIELIAGFAILASGAAPIANLTISAIWIALAVWFCVQHLKSMTHWTEERLKITHDLVEKMIGQATRRSQQPRNRSHEGEDEALADYLASSQRLDKTSLYLAVILPGTFMVANFLGLSASFARAREPLSLAVSVGGVLLAQGALSRILTTATSLGRALIAGRKVGPMLAAARQSPKLGSHIFASARTGPTPATPVVSALEVTYQYPSRSARSLHGLTIHIQDGERVILTGPSGSGKSTLAAILAGLRSPQSGLVLLHGVDVNAIGEEQWRRAIVITPQFNENHLVSASFAFNLLMARSWPPWPEDLERAEAICRELGLGDLLERMPAGIHQHIGEHGWQLSHGERSRVFVARALLQEPQLLILDESLGALDPDNTQRVLDCVEHHARTLIVITHP